ncbi:MAG TPA: peptidoglycan DD-metalloendopeptidase family protein [Candidatus Saccharimonadales bacterium]|nr:peptidoglycan DD-metalloendopeptidase family protein [Candidatus Saccharimonadales bacterium]
MATCRFLGIALLVVFLGTALTASVAYAEEKPKTTAERVAELEKESAAAKAAAAELKIVIEAATARVDLLGAQRAAASAAVDALRLEIQVAEQALVTSAAQLDIARAEIARLGAEIALQVIRLEDKKAVYAAHLRVTYREQQISPLEMLLSTRSLADFSARVDTLLRIDRDDIRQTQEIKALTAELQATRAIAAAKEQDLVVARQRLAAQRTALLGQRGVFESIVRQAGEAVSIASGARDDAAAGRAEALASSARADAAVRALAAEFERAENSYPESAAKLAAASGLGLFGTARLARLPVTDGLISSRFGPRDGGFHNGLDLAAPLYTPVLAAADGVVVTVGHPYLASGDTAEVVIIAHGRDFTTLYGHLDDLVKLPPVTVGQKVKAGDVIGYVGMSGRTSGPHLHFMAILNGKALDPLALTPAR